MSWLINELAKGTNRRNSTPGMMAADKDAILRLALTQCRRDASGIFPSNTAPLPIASRPAGTSVSQLIADAVRQSDTNNTHVPKQQAYLAQRLPNRRHSIAIAPTPPPTPQQQQQQRPRSSSAPLHELTSSILRQRKVDFPTRLRAVLSAPEFAPIIAWMPHGYAWKILDISKFVAEIIPAFFDYSPMYPCNLNTFICMLELWGFSQITHGVDASAYYHEAFLRGVPTVQSLMRSSGSMSSSSNASKEPDFYKLQPLPPESPPPAEPCGGTSMVRPTTAAPPASLLRSLLRSSSSGAPPIALDKPPSTATVSQGKALHQVNLEYLRNAKALADYATTARTAPTANPLVGVSAVKPSGDSSNRSMPLKPSTAKQTNHKKTKQRKPKKPRRKWLPPLGPAIPSAAALWKIKNQRTGGKGKNKTSLSSTDPDWFFTNPEVFATLTEVPQSNKQP